MIHKLLKRLHRRQPAAVRLHTAPRAKVFCNPKLPATWSPAGAGGAR